MSKNKLDRERQERLTALKKLFQHVAPAGIPGERYGTNRKLEQLIQERGLTAELLDPPDLPTEAELVGLLVESVRPAEASEVVAADVPAPEPVVERPPPDAFPAPPAEPRDAEFRMAEEPVAQVEPPVPDSVSIAVPVELLPQVGGDVEFPAPGGAGSSDEPGVRQEPSRDDILEGIGDVDDGEPEGSDEDLDLGESFDEAPVGGEADGSSKEDTLPESLPQRTTVEPANSGIRSRKALVVLICSAAVLVFAAIAGTYLVMRSQRDPTAPDPAIVNGLRSENDKLRAVLTDTEAALTDTKAQADVAERARQAAHEQVVAAGRLVEAAIAAKNAALDRAANAREEREKEDEKRERAKHASRAFKSLRALSDEDAERLAQMTGLDKDQVRASTPNMLDALRRIRELEQELKQRGGSPSATVTPSAPPLKAEAGGDRTVNVGVALDFDGTASTGNILEYRWRFGDGDEAAGKTASHTYVTSSTFTVTLTVKDDRGQVAQDSFTVTVK